MGNVKYNENMKSQIIKYYFNKDMAYEITIIEGKYN